jgi:hypothetical protein
MDFAIFSFCFEALTAEAESGRRDVSSSGAWGVVVKAELRIGCTTTRSHLPPTNCPLPDVLTGCHG